MSAEGYTSLAMVLRECEWDRDAAERAFKRTMELNSLAWFEFQEFCLPSSCKTCNTIRFATLHET